MAFMKALDFVHQEMNVVLHRCTAMALSKWRATEVLSFVVAAFFAWQYHS
jgi:hypothetical protein